MTFSDRQYDLYVVLGHPESLPVWAEPTWSKIAAAIDPLIKTARAPAAVRTLQLHPGSGSPNQRAVSFGRIGWNLKGHEKWVHQPHDSVAEDRQRQFVDAEIWAPSWTTCEKQSVAPDFYLSVQNEGAWSKQIIFNPSILLAVAKVPDATAIDQGKTTATKIAESVSSVLRVHSERPWAGRVTSNAINDLLVSGLFEKGLRHNRPVSPAILRGAWETF